MVLLACALVLAGAVAVVLLGRPRAPARYTLSPSELDTAGRAQWLRIHAAPLERSRIHVTLGGRTPRHLWAGDELRVGTPPLAGTFALLRVGVDAEEVHVPIVAGPFLRLARWEGEVLALRLSPDDRAALGLGGDAGLDRSWLRAGADAAPFPLPAGGTVAFRVARAEASDEGGLTVWLDARVRGAEDDDWGRITDPGAASAVPGAGTTLTLAPRLVAGWLAAGAGRKATGARLRRALAADPVPGVDDVALPRRPALFVREGEAAVDWALPLVAVDGPAADGLELSVRGALRLAGDPVGGELTTSARVEAWAHRCRGALADTFVPCPPDLRDAWRGEGAAVEGRLRRVLPPAPAVAPLLVHLLGDARAARLVPTSVAVADDLATTARLRVAPAPGR